MAYTDAYTGAYADLYGAGSFTDVYRGSYGNYYGTLFPAAPLDVGLDLNLGGTWTDVTPLAYQRDQGNAIAVAHGRPDESGSCNPATYAGQFNNRAGQFSPTNPLGEWYGLLGRNTPLRCSVPALESYLRIEDDAVSGASCPAAAPLNVSAPLDIRIDLRPSGYAPCVLASKWLGLSVPTGGTGTPGLFGASITPAENPGQLSSVEAAYNAWSGLVLPKPQFPGIQARRVYYAGAIPTGAIDNQIQSCLDLKMKACISFIPAISGSRTSANLPSLGQMQSDQDAMVTYLQTVATAFENAGMTPASDYMSVTMCHEPTNSGSSSHCTAAQFTNLYATPASGGQSNYQALTAICPVIVDLLGNSGGANTAANYFPAGSCDGLAVDYYGGNWVSKVDLTVFSALADAAGIPFGLWEIGDSAGGTVPTVGQMTNFLAFLGDFFGTAPGGRLAEGLANLEIIWFQDNGSGGHNIILSAGDYRIPLLQQLYAATSASGEQDGGSGGSGDRSWALVLNGDGTLGFWWTTDGTLDTLQSVSSQLPLPLGRVTARVYATTSGGQTTVAFYTAGGGNAGNAGTGAPWMALGEPAGPVTMDVYASTAPVTIGYNSALSADNAAYGGLTGGVFEFEIRSFQGQYSDIYDDLYGAPTGGLVVADPGFFGQAEGATTLTDAQGNPWALSGTAEISTRVYLGHFEMSSLPTTWDVSGSDVWSPVQAGGLLRRLSQGTQPPVVSAFRQFVLGLSGENTPAAYWPAEDASGATTISPAIGVAPITFTTAPDLASDTSFVCSAAIPTIGTCVMQGPVTPYSGGTAAVIRFLMNPAAATSIDGNTVICRVNTTGNIGDLTLWWQSGGDLRLSGYGSRSGGEYLFDTGPTGEFSLEGEQVLVSMELTTVGKDLGWAISALAVGSSVPTTVSGTVSNASPGNATEVHFNAPGGNLNELGLGHVFVQTAYEPLTDFAEALAAFAGETCANRFARLCAENSVGSRIYGYPDTDVPMGPQAPDTLVNLLTLCETTGRGLVYEPRRSLTLGYRTVNSLCQQVPALVADYSRAQVGIDASTLLAPTIDDQHTVNDVSLQQNAAPTNFTPSNSLSGASWETTLDDGSPMSISPPPVGVGDYGNSYTVNVNDGTQLPNVAGWILNIGTNAEERYPSIPFNLARPGAAPLFFALQETEVGDYIQVINPPAFLGPGPLKQLVYGTSLTFGGMQWQMELNTVPETPYEVGVYAGPVYGHADTDGSQLDSGVPATPVADGYGDVYEDAYGAEVGWLYVDPTGPSGILWTTNPSDLPFDVSAAGEVMTVTAISGDASPQLFTVTRGVNGIAKAHVAGEAVSLAHPAIVALA